MPTECYKIEWTGFYTLDKAHSQPEARKLGLYAVYKPVLFDEPILWYIGKATEIGAQLNKHRQEWQKILSPEQLNELEITIGVLTSLDGMPATERQLGDVESLFLNEYHPKGNDPSTMKGYKGRSALVVSTGKRVKVRKLTAHDKNLVKLIKNSTVTDWGW
jgi:hypothetical protein